MEDARVAVFMPLLELEQLLLSQWLDPITTFGRCRGLSRWWHSHWKEPPEWIKHLRVAMRPGYRKLLFKALDWLGYPMFHKAPKQRMAIAHGQHIFRWDFFEVIIDGDSMALVLAPRGKLVCASGTFTREADAIPFPHPSCCGPLSLDRPPASSIMEAIATSEKEVVARYKLEGICPRSCDKWIIVRGRAVISPLWQLFYPDS